MSNKTISLDYVNSIVFELEKAFWDERGKGCRFRLTPLGRQYFLDKILPELQSGEPAHVVQTVQAALQSDGLADAIACMEDGRLLRVCVQGCAHRPVEEQMAACGVRPFACMPANLIGLAIEDKLDRPVELAEIKLEGGEPQGACQLLLVLFDKRPELA